MPLPMIGELSYNGVPFDAASEVRVSEEFIKDPANRTTTLQQITLEVSGWLAPISDEADVATLRVALSKQGAPLIYTGNGFPLVVNAPGRPNAIADVNFGPSPRILEFKSKGGSTAATIKWQVTTWIPACISADGTYGRFIEFNYQVSWNRKPNGYTTRTISGHYKVPIIRTGRLVTNHSDTYRESVEAKFPPVTGWKRSANFTMLRDKATETFTITDEEIESENPYPPGVTNIQSRHRIAWNVHGGNGGRIQNRLSATISMAAGYDAGAAQAVFRRLCDKRLGAALSLAKSSGGILLIESMEGDEDLYGKSHSFSVGYRITMKLPESNPNTKEMSFLVLGEQFLTLSAFNGPIALNTWEKWSSSMQGETSTPGPFSPRGTGSEAGTTWGSDRITDLCDGDGNTIPFTRPEGFRPKSSSPGPSVWSVEKPREEASWLSYRHAWTRFGQAKDVATVRMVTESTGVDKKPPIRIDKSDRGGPVLNEFAGQLNFDDTKLKRVITQGGGDMWLVKGSLERVIYKLPNIPSSIKLADQKATLQLIDGYLESRQDATPLGLKVNSGSFAALYVANKTLETAPPDFCYP